MPWQPPNLTVRWGAYSKPDGEEQAQLVTATLALLGADHAAVVTREIVLEKLRGAGVLDIESVQAVIEALDKEKADAEAKAVADADRELDHSLALADGTAKAKVAAAGVGAPPKGPPK